MNDLFKSLPISEKQNDAMRMIASNCDALIDALSSYTTEGRYLSICKTKLEEFALFANKAITRDFSK